MAEIKRLEKGSKVDVEITDVSDKGMGIGKVHGAVVFVAGASFGDKVVAEITKSKKNYAMAKTVEILEKSPYRRHEADVCPYIWSGCGGCSLGELNYEGQKFLKLKQVYDKLTRIGKLENPIVRDVIGADSVNGYRNKGVIACAGGKVGFKKAGTNFVIDCDYCKIQSEEANLVGEAVRHYFSQYPKAANNVESILVRTGMWDGEERQVLVGITGSTKKLTELQALVDEICDRVNLVSFYEFDVDRGAKAQWNLVAGQRTIKCVIGSHEYEVYPSAFFQVNDEQVVKLYDKVAEYAGLDGSQVVLDLYCGVGTIGLHLADGVKYIVGIEINPDSVVNANRNAVINGVVNARYFAGKAEEVLPKLLKKPEGVEEGKDDFYVEHAHVAVLDPPRAGCEQELLDAVVYSGVDRIVYVSCDAGSLARDVAYLQDKGFKFEEATPCDMFPETGHVETIALLQRR